jgi:hypothetical protein
MVGCIPYINPIRIKKYNEDFTTDTDDLILKVIYSSIEDVNESYATITGKRGRHVLGFKYLIGNTCIITVVKPDGWDDHNALAVIGHEILHCQGAKHSK